MPTYAVTAATGALGRLIVEDLLTRTDASNVVAIVRDPAKAADLTAQGVTVRQADYDDPQALTAALQGVDAVVLVSGTEFGKRVQQHGNVIEAAKSAGVGHVAYTSAPHADTTTLGLAPEHKATEEVLVASGVPYTLLRNNWYTENYLGQLDAALATGQLVGNARDGVVASASRADYAAAAAVVVTGGAAHHGKTYELGGDTAWDRPTLAATLSKVIGKPVTYKDVSVEEHVAALTAAGLDEGTAGFVAQLDSDIADGTLAEVTGELSTLIGRPTTPIEDTFAQAYAARG